MDGIAPGGWGPGVDVISPEAGEVLARQKAKRKAKRHGRGPKPDLSINSLLDILSVILVFLMKSYSASAVQIKPSKDLNPPFTNSVLPVEESTAVTVTLNNIMVDDEPVIALDSGKVPEASLSAGGMQIDPLLERLQSEVSHRKRIASVNKSVKTDLIVTIIGDRFVPATLLAQIMYTAGQAEYSKFKFALVKVERN